MDKGSNTNYYCHGGAIRYRCVCPPGYSVHIVPFGTYTSGFLDYTCCLGESSEEFECGDWAFMEPLIVSMMVVGIIGLLASFAVQLRKSTIAGLTEEDRRVLEAPPDVPDGSKIHRVVEPKNWCVTLDDLRQFKRLVHEAVLTGRIQPTDRDPFDVANIKIGPSAYTVNDQFIKPVTAAAWPNPH